MRAWQGRPVAEARGGLKAARGAMAAVAAPRPSAYNTKGRVWGSGDAANRAADARRLLGRRGTRAGGASVACKATVKMTHGSMVVGDQCTSALPTTTRWLLRERVENCYGLLGFRVVGSFYTPEHGACSFALRDVSDRTSNGRGHLLGSRFLGRRPTSLLRPSQILLLFHLFIFYVDFQCNFRNSFPLSKFSFEHNYND